MLRRVHDCGQGCAVLAEEEDRCGVELRGLHAVGKVVRLGEVDALVREDDALGGVKRPPRNVEAADQAADRRSERGVFVHIECGSAVGYQPTSLLPETEALGGRTEGATVEPSTRGRADIARSEHQCPERNEPERPGHVGWRDDRAALHQPIVGCTG